jgi:hypothetical protein
MLEFDELPDIEKRETFTKATPCSINKGVLDDDGNQIPIATSIYVDDFLLVAVWMHFTRLLRSVIEAIFIVTGRPNTSVRQCTLAMDKWVGMKVSWYAVLLGLMFDTRTMTIAITDEYRIDLLNLLNSTWHAARKTFTVNELEVLIGKCARLGEAANWVFHLIFDDPFVRVDGPSSTNERALPRRPIKKLRAAHQDDKEPQESPFGEDQRKHGCHQLLNQESSTTHS